MAWEEEGCNANRVIPKWKPDRQRFRKKDIESRVRLWGRNERAIWASNLAGGASYTPTPVVPSEKKMVHRCDRSHNFHFSAPLWFFFFFFFFFFLFSHRIIFQYRYFALFFFFFFNIFERIADIFLVDKNVGHEVNAEHRVWRVMYINWELILKNERLNRIYTRN